MKKGDHVIWNKKLCTVWNIKEDGYQILLPERNVELRNLSNIYQEMNKEFKKGDFVLYIKNNNIEIARVMSIDMFYE